jgi:dipeptidyl aminopeptidase/acylaminoacyl peptidase
MRFRFAAACLCLVLVSACGGGSSLAQSGKASTLREARAGHVTKLAQQTREGTPPPVPPTGVFDLVQFPSPVGKLAAYLSPRPAGGGRHPAIIWITGGDNNTIGDVWSPADPANDQTAAAFREAGIVMMYPSQRGGNVNPGFRESFYGEVDDVLAAVDYLAKLDYVDPARIYLGGHSTGGTLVLLTAEMSVRFRAVFAFGPVEDAGYYGGNYTYFDVQDATERKLRSPIHWLESISSPVFVIEGAGRGNADSLDAMRAVTRNPQLHFFVVPGHDHFSVLAPATKLIAGKIVADDVKLSQAELDTLP